MFLRKSKSGSGVYMFTPSGNHILYASLNALENFVEGEAEWVKFVLGDVEEKNE